MPGLSTNLHVTAKADKIPFWEKTAYGAGQIGNGISSIPKYMAAPLFVIYLGISPILVSAMMSLFLLWDAISDPVMGTISDNFRSQYGRRRPFIVAGAILSAIILPFIFLFDRSWSHEAIMGYLLGVGILFYTADTMFNMPYQSLLLEMTADYNERTSISAFRGILGKVTAVFIGWIWAFTQLPMFADPDTGTPDTLAGARWASVIAALVLVAFCVLPGIFCKERYYKLANKQKREPVVGGMIKTLKSIPLLLLIGLTMLMTTTAVSVNDFGVYLTNYYVFGGDSAPASVYAGIGGTVANIFGVAVVPFVVVAARKTSKEKVLGLVLVGNIAIAISIWFCYTPEIPWLSVIPGVLKVPLLSATWVVIPAMLADVVDHDELKYSERREGSFSAAFSWCVKASFTIATALTGPLVAISGFDAGETTQSADTLFNMRFLMSTVPLVGLIGCIVLLKFYPLTPSTARKVREDLEARRGKITKEES